MHTLPERGQLTLWQEVTDPRSGLTYWWNRSTDETTHVGAPKPHPGPIGKTVASVADTGSEAGPDLAALSHSQHAAAEDEDTGTGGTLGTSRNGGEGFEDEGDAGEADVEGSGESDLEW